MQSHGKHGKHMGKNACRHPSEIATTPQKKSNYVLVLEVKLKIAGAFQLTLELSSVADHKADRVSFFESVRHCNVMGLKQRVQNGTKCSSRCSWSLTQLTHERQKCMPALSQAYQGENDLSQCQKSFIFQRKDKLWTSSILFPSSVSFPGS